jgi:hypothetical protein
VTNDREFVEVRNLEMLHLKFEISEGMGSHEGAKTRRNLKSEILWTLDLGPWSFFSFPRLETQDSGLWTSEFRLVGFRAERVTVGASE